MANGENCNFKGCLHPVHGGYESCLQHLKELTELNVAKIVIEVVTEVLDVEAEKVTPNASFIDDLGADSLDAAALAIEFGAALDIVIPREDIERIQGVRDAIRYVTTRLFSESEPRFIMSPNINLEAIHQHIEQNPKNVSLLLGPIVQNALFQDYFSRLELKTENIEQAFRLAVRNNWIDDVTTAPDFDVNKTLLGVDVIILCREVICYFRLKTKSIAFTSCPLADLRLSYRIHYSERDEISEIEISGGLRNTHDADETFMFKTQEGVVGALTFLKKCLRNMETVR